MVRVLSMLANIGSLHAGKLILFASLSAVDLYLTNHLLQQSGGCVYESNPIASAWLASYGWPGLIAFKAVSMFLVITACSFISISRPRMGGMVLSFACTALAAVVIYSFSLAGSSLLGHPGNKQAVHSKAEQLAYDEADPEVTP